MSSRALLSLVFAFACTIQIGCAGCLQCARMNGGCGMCASCGVPEASCACPDCGCADPCCDVACGCPEPECGCVDECCDPCCGVPGCGSRVGGGCILGTHPLLQGLRNLICGEGCGCCGAEGCSGCCSGETYYGDWHCDQARCEPCDQCGNYTGAQHAMPMAARRPNVAKRVQADQIRFADGAHSTRR
jgi:hypothetical protein